MGKLHELLAVEPSLKGTVDKVLKETTETFDKRNAAYMGFTKTYAPFDDADLDKAPAESKPVGYTVSKKVEYLAGHYEKLLDCLLQKETGNTKAIADLVVKVEDDKGVEKEILIAKSVPATMLLNLEHRLEELRKVMDGAPTLDPNHKWEWDKNEGCWHTQEFKTLRTKKVPRVITKAPATDKFPAQVELYTEDLPVGTWTQVIKSGSMSLTEKSALLQRIDVLLRAVKAARMRANDIEVESPKLGKKLFDFLVGKAA